jgi:hypothetical protein
LRGRRPDCGSHRGDPLGRILRSRGTRQPSGRHEEIPAGPQLSLIHLDLPSWLSADRPEFMYLWLPGW